MNQAPGRTFPLPHYCAQPPSCVQLFATPWTVTCQAPLPMGFFGQQYWNGLPFPSPGDLPHSGTKSKSLASPALQAESTAEPHKGRHTDY